LKANAFWVGFVACASLTVAVFAQSGSSTRSGVYTADQAAQGQALYTQQCAMCHGATLAGSGQTPALAGPVFLHNWVGQTVGDLSSKLQATMPATNPGSLKPDQVSELVAFILKSNHYPAGNTKLPSDESSLAKIHFEAPGH
jgi:S-disulfanyl-L-cysteine oxidoreductase SoxD